MPFDRTRFRDAWQSNMQGGLTPEFLSNFIRNNPDFAEGVQQYGDNVLLPTGEMMDLINDVGGAGRSQWSGYGGDQPTPPSNNPPAGPSNGTSYQSGITVTDPTAPTNSGYPNRVPYGNPNTPAPQPY